MSIIQQAGVLAYPLILCSLIALTIILERTFFWSFVRKERFFSGLTTLETIVSITPVLGILGTILGVMDIFAAQDLSSQEGFQILSLGIAKALTTTALGLSVSVIGLVFYNLFMSLGEKYAKKESH